MIFVLSRDKDFLGSENFETNHIWCPILGQEKLTFVHTDVQNGVISPGMVHKGNVNIGRKAFIDLFKT